MEDCFRKNIILWSSFDGKWSEKMAYHLYLRVRSFSWSWRADFFWLWRAGCSICCCLGLLVFSTEGSSNYIRTWKRWLQHSQNRFGPKRIFDSWRFGLFHKLQFRQLFPKQRRIYYVQKMEQTRSNWEVVEQSRLWSIPWFRSKMMW